MTWTANIIWLGPAADTQEAAVDLTDGAIVISGKYQTNGTLASLTPQLVQRVSRIAVKPVSDLSEGLSFDVVPADTKPATPSDEELARQAFFTAYRLFVSMNRGVSYGLIDPNDADYLSVKQNVLKLYTSAYVSLL